MKPTRLLWTGELQPTQLSRIYRVQIAYTAGRFPTVQVIDPLLESRPDESLPHVYDNGSLCLHLPEEWSSRMLIADTIAPWAAEWLLHYEVWKAGGEWYGGGEWPPRRIAETPLAPATVPTAPI